MHKKGPEFLNHPGGEILSARRGTSIEQNQVAIPRGLLHPGTDGIKIVDRYGVTHWLRTHRLDLCRHHK